LGGKLSGKSLAAARFASLHLAYASFGARSLHAVDLAPLRELTIEERLRIESPTLQGGHSLRCPLAHREGVPPKCQD
jgi:hypothetical protein